MKLKKTLVFSLSLCVALGAGMTAVACGETNTPDTTADNVTFTINVDTDAPTALADVKVLFFSDDESKVVSLNGTSASVELPEGDYIAYLTGRLPGYTYTPVKLSKAQASATIYVEEAEEDEDGNIPVQVLVLYPGGDKVFKGSDEKGNKVQLCTSEGQEGVQYVCYTAFFDNMYMACLNMASKPFVIQAARYDIHFLESDWPEGYTFDDNEYSTSDVGGFYSVELKKA